MMHIGPLGENLIFLISQPRAGSTLLQLMLAPHPDIATVNETWLMLYPIHALKTQGLAAPYNFAKGREALTDFLEVFPDGKDIYLQGVRAMGTKLYDMACSQLGKSHFLDKTPRYYRIIPELVKCFPNAKYIFLIRNPLAVLSSILDTWTNGTWILLARENRDDLLLAPELLRSGIDQLADRAIVEHYEQLVTQPQQTIKNICDYLDLEFLPSMLEYNLDPIQEGQMGDPTGVQRYHRPTPNHIDRWLQLGENAQTRHLAFRYLDTLGGELISSLGYDSDNLRRKLQEISVRRKGFVVRWEQIFPERLTTRCRFFLLLMELIQRRNFASSIKRMGKLFLGRL